MIVKVFDKVEGHIIRFEIEKLLKGLKTEKAAAFDGVAGSTASEVGLGVMSKLCFETRRVLLFRGRPTFKGKSKPKECGRICDLFLLSRVKEMYARFPKEQVVECSDNLS